MSRKNERGAYSSQIAPERLTSRGVDDDKVTAFLLSPGIGYIDICCCSSLSY